MLLSGNITQKIKEHKEGPTKNCKTLRYDGCHGDQHLFDFILRIVGQTKGVAVCLHSAQVTRREGTWVVVLFEYRKCWWTAVARNMRQKSSFLQVWNATKNVYEWLHERQARIRKAVAVTFLIWPAFSYFFVLFHFIWSANQGGQHNCPSYVNVDKMAGT